MGNILSRNLLVSAWKWDNFNHTLIKAAHLPQKFEGGGDPPLFPPLALPLPRRPCPRLVEMDGSASVDARVTDIASVGGARCDARGGAYSASRWRIVGADKALCCGAAAGPPRSHRRPPSSYSPSLFWLEGPSFADPLSFCFSFSAARSRLLPPFVTPAPLRASSNCLEASPSTGRGRLPQNRQGSQAKGKVRVRV